MARLPQPGGDSGTWGNILNEFLTQALKPDGTIKDSAVTASSIAPNAVDATSIADGSITEALLDSAVQIKLNAVAGTPDWTTITNKPAVIAAGATASAAKAALNLTKADVGLGNVDNTSDAAKNIAVATLSNKVFDNSNTLALKDNNFTLQDDGDTTKQAKFQLSNITSSTTRTLTVPNASGTLALTSDISSKLDENIFNEKVLAGANLVIGPDFEDTTIGRPFGVWPAVWDAGIVTYSTEQARSGTHSLKVLVPNGDDGEGGVASDTWLSITGFSYTQVDYTTDFEDDPTHGIKVQPGQVFYFEVYVKPHASNNLLADELVLIGATMKSSTNFNASNEYLEISVTADTLSLGVWTKLSGTLTVPAGKDLMYPKLEVYNYNNTAPTLNIYYWDDVRIADVTDTTATALTIANKKISNPKVDQINDINGNASLSIAAMPSAVNYMVLTNAGTGAYPGFTATGTDANVGLAFVPKGTGIVEIYLGGGQTTTTFGVAGPATNIDLNLGSKGSGVVKANSNPVISSVTGIPAVTGTPSSSTYLRGDGTWSSVGAGGDASTNTTTSVDSEVALFSGTDGKTFKRATGSGIATLTSGVLGTVSAPSGAIVGVSDTQTLTNKRITKRVNAISNNPSSISINTDNYDVIHVTSQTAALSFTIAASMSPADGDTLRVSVTGTASVALSWDSNFGSSTVTLPATTSGTNRLDVGFFWNTETSKWRCVAVA